MSNINDFVRPTSNTDRRDINKILELIHDLVAAPAEDEGAQERITHASHLKKRTTTVTTGGPTRTGSNFRDKENFAWRRNPPAIVKSYSLIHTSNSFSGVTFPVKDTKFGARMDLDGTGFIKVDDNIILKPTDKITIIGWFYLIKNSTTQHVVKMQESSTPYNLRITNTDILKIRIRTDNAGGTTYNKDIAAANWTDNQWNHIVATWSGAPDNRLRIYLNKVKEGSDVVTAGALQYSGTPGLGIGSGPAGGSNKAISGTRMARLSILHEELTQAQIDNHFDALLDTDAAEEILTLDFMGDENPTPDETSGGCKSS